MISEMNYTLTVTQTVTYDVKVKATSEEDAMEKAKDAIIHNNDNAQCNGDFNYSEEAITCEDSEYESYLSFCHYENISPIGKNEDFEKHQLEKESEIQLNDDYELYVEWCERNNITPVSIKEDFNNHKEEKLLKDWYDDYVSFYKIEDNHLGTLEKEKLGIIIRVKKHNASMCKIKCKETGKDSFIDVSNLSGAKTIYKIPYPAKMEGDINIEARLKITVKELTDKYDFYFFAYTQLQEKEAEYYMKRIDDEN